MHTASDVAAVRESGRDAVTWYCYLLLGYFTYVIGIQGNIIPFLRAELDLSYQAVSLHTSAIAAGIILVGLFGDRVVRRFGRRFTFAAMTLGSAGAGVLLTVAPAVWASIGSCFLFGLFGAFIPAMVPAILSDIHGRWRDVAYAEANAVAYVFTIMAPILTGLCVWIGWGWRVAVLAGSASAVVIVLSFWRNLMPASLETRESAEMPLTLAFWCYWAMLAMSVAVEFSVLLWAPAYLEQVVGLTPTSAALGAAAFFAGMLVGRVAGSWLVRIVATRRLFLGSAVATFVGFAAYWGTTEPIVSIAGLFVVGLGVAQLFPLTLSFAIGAAGEAADRASARIMLGPGIAVLVNPPLLGAIADSAGLRVAQLMTPLFMSLAVFAFLAGAFVQRRRPAA
jgi:fucose permease